eukprot:CAMPEP_0206369724 /NCGR_PEP_ID=MMETSP0294-20121207/5475_1 /ASSEMBLY_ACC=CAM_ASM_000327 /TAXON_ID=39354 /ORGANISM="Heterosigma akashiwo, Strain CCMP2393" /LENGTH=217 /DNA_ID=CAMNT_0053816549 /DNA_START=45 /DNA_END=694 /DNA_ORIENTATION=+
MGRKGFKKRRRLEDDDCSSLQKIDGDVFPVEHRRSKAKIDAPANPYTSQRSKLEILLKCEQARKFYNEDFMLQYEKKMEIFGSRKDADPLLKAWFSKEGDVIETSTNSTGVSWLQNALPADRVQAFIKLLLDSSELLHLGKNQPNETGPFLGKLGALCPTIELVQKELEKQNPIFPLCDMTLRNEVAGLKRALGALGPGFRPARAAANPHEALGAGR